MTSAPSASCTSIARSGERKWREPSRCERNVTPSSAISTRPGPARSRPSARSPRLNTWKPPESVRSAPAPRHEPVEAAEAADALVPGAEEQVVGVGEEDPRAERLEIARLERLHGRRGPHGHEDRRLDRPARGRQPAAPGGAVAREDLEADHAAGFARARAGVKATGAPSGAATPSGPPPRACARRVPPARRHDLEPDAPFACRRRAGSSRRSRAATRVKKPSFSRIATSSPTSGSCPGQRTAQPPSDTLMVVASSADAAALEPEPALDGPARRPLLERDRLAARRHGEEPGRGEAVLLEVELDARRERRAPHAPDQRDLAEERRADRVAVDARRGPRPRRRRATPESVGRKSVPCFSRQPARNCDGSSWTETLCTDPPRTRSYSTAGSPDRGRNRAVSA